MTMPPKSPAEVLDRLPWNLPIAVLPAIYNVQFFHVNNLHIDLPKIKQFYRFAENIIRHNPGNVNYSSEKAGAFSGENTEKGFAIRVKKQKKVLYKF